MVDYVAYYRVSTERQGKSGLGLAAQREAVRVFVEPRGRLVEEFTEIQSGRRNDRKVLAAALSTAKARKAKLVIARLDRFSRRMSFIARIMDEGVGLTVAEMPDATEFQLHIFAALAQEERRLIAERTKAALAEAKRRGVRLGSFGVTLAERNRHKAVERRRRIEEAVGSNWDGFSHYRKARLVAREIIPPCSLLGDARTMI